MPTTTTNVASDQQHVEEKDDGLRYKCSNSACGAYVKPDPDGDGDGRQCDACEEWRALCADCMPDWGIPNVVWICEECR